MAKVIKPMLSKLNGDIKSLNDALLSHSLLTVSQKALTGLAVVVGIIVGSIFGTFIGAVKGAVKGGNYFFALEGYIGGGIGGAFLGAILGPFIGGYEGYKLAKRHFDPAPFGKVEMIAEEYVRRVTNYEKYLTRLANQKPTVPTANTDHYREVLEARKEGEEDSKKDAGKEGNKDLSKDDADASREDSYRSIP